MIVGIVCLVFGAMRLLTAPWATPGEHSPRRAEDDLRHSFASMLLHEGRSVVYGARQMGHSTAVFMRVYAHVVEELEDAPRISAEDAIAAARSAGGRITDASGGRA
jgi:hypothetical protein